MGSSRTKLITTASALLALGAVLGFALAGWPGEPNGCRENMRPTCFCETPRSGLVAQRANTFSNLGFIVVGLGIAVVTDRQRRNRPKRRNLLTRTDLYPTLFAVVTVLLGPGSMFLHASLTRWGGLVDVASMYLFAGFVLFRMADILKPWPASWADRAGWGGLSVMLDDVLAGAYAWAALYAVVWVLG